MSDAEQKKKLYSYLIIYFLSFVGFQIMVLIFTVVQGIYNKTVQTQEIAMKLWFLRNESLSMRKANKNWKILSVWKISNERLTDILWRWGNADMERCSVMASKQQIPTCNQRSSQCTGEPPASSPFPICWHSQRGHEKAERWNCLAGVVLHFPRAHVHSFNRHLLKHLPQEELRAENCPNRASL